MADELDTGAILSATDRLMRTLRGPLGGAASWEWSDLLAAATGRSPFEFTSLAREAGLAVPDPSNVQPAAIAAQLLLVARDLEPADRARVHRVARLLDPSLPEHDLADDDTQPPLEEVASGAPQVDQPPAPEAVPTPKSVAPVESVPTPVKSVPTPESVPPAEPAPPMTYQPPPPPMDPGPSPHPAFRTGPPQTPPRGMQSPQMPPGQPPPTLPDAKPEKRNRVGHVIWIGVVAFFVLRGLIEGGFGGG